MARYAMVADLNRCVGCQTCTAACKHTNATPPEIQWRKVLDVEFGEFPDVDRVFMPVGCQHCADPPCMHVCPSTATGQRDDGIVTIDYDLCIGCSYCAVACPYQARYKVDKPEFSYGNEPTSSEALRFDEKRLGVAQKCTFCSDRVDEGLADGLTPGVDPEATPGCVNSCIANALHFGDIEDENSNISKLLAENAYFKMHDELETDTGFYYLWNKRSDDDKQAGDKTMRFGSYLQTNWDWRAAGNFMFGGTGSAFMFFVALATFPENPSPVLSLLSLAFVGLGLGLVWLEIGRPWRFINVFFHPQTSWMTREGAVGVLLFLLTFAGIFLKQPVLIGLAGLTGLAFLYCQARILKEAKGIPAWRTPAVMPFIITTGLCEGAALLLLLSALLFSSTQWLSYVLLALLIARITVWVNYRMALTSVDTPVGTINELTRVDKPFVLLGNVIPILLLLFLEISPQVTTIMELVCILTIVAGWYLKFVIVTRASFVQGYGLTTPVKH